MKKKVNWIQDANIPKMLEFHNQRNILPNGVEPELLKFQVNVNARARRFLLFSLKMSCDRGN